MPANPVPPEALGDNQRAFLEGLADRVEAKEKYIAKLERQLALMDHAERREYIYAIACDDLKVVKLGIARNPKQRLRALQTANGSELRLVLTIPTFNPSELEKRIHDLLEPLHVRGEWFRIEALELLQAAAYELRSDDAYAA